MIVMGDPRKFKNKYSRPRRLWDPQRLEDEKKLKSEYGLKSMRELWIALAELKKYRREARRLLSLSEEERKNDAERMLAKLRRLNMLKERADLDDILSLGPRDVLERRLQTLVYRKGMAVSMLQSRQLITHGFIAIEGKNISRPGYLVNIDEEKSMSYSRPIEIMMKTKEKAADVKPEEAKKE